MKLIKPFLTISGFTFISKILGFIRDILIAAFVGAGVIADVFFVAFKLPNFFRRIFAEGAFSAAFIPIFSLILKKEGKSKIEGEFYKAFESSKGNPDIFKKLLEKISEEFEQGVRDYSKVKKDNKRG